MPVLKLKEHDEEKERKFTLDCQLKMTPEERFRMLFEKARMTRDLLKAYGHTPPPQIVKRKTG